MSSLDVFIALAGLVATVLVVAGMILITPRGQVDVYGDETDPQGSELSRAGATGPVLVAARRPESRVGH